MSENKVLFDIPAGLHPETTAELQKAVAAMAEGLLEKQRGGIPPLSWMADNWEADCARKIQKCIHESRYADAMNYLMFARHHSFNLRLKTGRPEPVANASPTTAYTFQTAKDQEDYSDLLAVLLGALDQAAYGKGRERHANDAAFADQPMQAISDLLASPLGMAYQVAKKVVEATNMPSVEQQERELFGAINYTAGMIIWLRRHRKA